MYEQAVLFLPWLKSHVKVLSIDPNNEIDWKADCSDTEVEFLDQVEGCERYMKESYGSKRFLVKKTSDYHLVVFCLTTGNLRLHLKNLSLLSYGGGAVQEVFGQEL